MNYCIEGEINLREVVTTRQWLKNERRFTREGDKGCSNPTPLFKSKMS